ncbi:MAG: serine hydrolase [Saprospiraceae bacterium]
MHKTYLLTIFLALSLSSCTVGRFFFYNFANINDYKKFQNEDIPNDSENVHYFAEAKQDSFLLPKLRKKDKRYDFAEGLDKTKTVAFLVMRNDTILYEHYDNGYEQYTPVNSFSMAKSYVSTLIGIARDEGLIETLEESVRTYLPYLPEEFQKVSIRNTLEMRTGVDYNESYVSPFSDAAVSYYGRNIQKQLENLEMRSEPDKSFNYRSINTQILAEIVEEVYQQPLNEIVTEKLWKPLGSEQAATWSVDKKKDGNFKAFCCLNAVARDFARLGLLFMNEGNWYGEQIVSKEWVKEATTFDRPKNRFNYTYQWWNKSITKVNSDTLQIPEMHMTFEYEQDGKMVEYVRWPTGAFAAEGHLGQYVYVSPKDRIVIVRLGKNYGNPSPGWSGYFKWIAERNGVNRDF